MLLIYGDFPEEILFFFLLVHRRFQNKQIFIYTYNSLLFVETVRNQLANLLQSYLYPWCAFLWSNLFYSSVIKSEYVFIHFEYYSKSYSFISAIIFLHSFLFMYYISFSFFVGGWLVLNLHDVVKKILHACW